MNHAAAVSVDYRSVFEATPGLYLVLDPHLNIIAVNDAYCRATNTVREEILGRGVFDAFPDNPNDPGADGVNNLRGSLERVLRLRQADAMAIQKYDIRRPESEGRGFEVRYWSLLNTPVLNARHEVSCIVHRVDDVTALVRLEAEGAARDRLAREQQRVIDQLRHTNEALALQTRENARLQASHIESKEALALQIRENVRLQASHTQTGEALSEIEFRFKLLAENLPGVIHRRIATPDEQFRDTYVSSGLKRLLGIDPEDVMSGKCSLFDFDHPDDRERKIKAYRAGAARGESVVIEVRKLRHPDRKICWWQIHASPTRLANGDIQWDSIALDITDRKAAEQQLNRALKMEAIGQLTGGVAHDFNNLLTVILSNADSFVEELPPDSNLRPLAEMTRAAAERGAELTNSLLAFARRQALEPTDVDVNKLVAGMDGLLRRSLGEDVEIEFVRGAGLWMATVDPVQLESALLNLALNARDAMPNGGKLTIETSNARIDQAYSDANDEVAPGQYVLLCMSDTGTGMTPETVARAFEPFFTTKEPGKGTGLGLSMVYGFVKQSGGHIKIYSEVGHGTLFKLYFPRALDANVKAETSVVRHADPIGSETILLVEDADLVRELGERLLRSLGYTVIVARDGVAALKILEQREDIDLLFTDVVMPGGIGGRQLADRAHVLRPSMKVLFTSGYTENAIVHHGRLDPGVHLVRKPYRKRDLALKLRAVLDSMAPGMG
jgi:PAS domain S-box-containing protein